MEQTDTITLHDTIVYNAPQPLQTVVLRVDTIRVPTAVTDTAKPFTDTVSAAIPVVQKEYTDSAYHAWVSGGLFASLDSIAVFPSTKYITQTKTITQTLTKTKLKRWGIGVQAGYGWNGTSFKPYIGMGVSYTLLGF